MRLVNSPKRKYISHTNLNLILRKSACRETAICAGAASSLLRPSARLSEYPTTHLHSELFDFFARSSWDIFFSPLPTTMASALNTRWGAECTDDPAGQPPGGGKVLTTVCWCPPSDLPGDGQVPGVWTSCFYDFRVKI